MDAHDTPSSATPVDGLVTLAVLNGLITEAQLAEAETLRAKFHAEGVPMSVMELLVKKRWLAQSQVADLKKQQQQALIKVVVPGYEMVAKLGQGATAAVFKARHVKMGHFVAIKLLLPSVARDPAFVERFMREARATAQVRHPNVIQGIDVGSINGVHYFIMDFVDGKPLSEILKKHGRFSEEETISVGIQMAAALAAVDAAGLVHRDIKPSNILMEQNGLAKLCDLGSVRLTTDDSSLTQTGATIGTPHYIAPEQAQGRKDLDIRVDIYSLGATLYRLATGHTLFAGDNSAAVMAAHITQQPLHPDDLGVRLSSGFVEIMTNMLAKDPDDRYQRPTDLLSDLQRLRDRQGCEQPAREAAPKKAERPRRPSAAQPIQEVATSQVEEEVVVATLVDPVPQPAQGNERSQDPDPPTKLLPVTQDVKVVSLLSKFDAILKSNSAGLFWGLVYFLGILLVVLGFIGAKEAGLFKRPDTPPQDDVVAYQGPTVTVNQPQDDPPPLDTWETVGIEWKEIIVRVDWTQSPNESEVQFHEIPEGPPIETEFVQVAAPSVPPQSDRVPIGSLGSVYLLSLGGTRGPFGHRLVGGRRRMALRSGGGKATESAVDAALRWLARNQEPDGHWRCITMDGKEATVAITGLALLAFLGAGHSENVGQYKDNVGRAVSWMKSIQNAYGAYYKEDETHGIGYHHAIAGLAMAEAAGMGRIPGTVASAQKAVDYSIDIHQKGEASDKLGWRYAAKSVKGDISISGWFIMQLKSAKLAGLHIDPAGFDGAIKFLDWVQNKHFLPGAGSHIYGYTDDSEPTFRRTAIGCAARQVLGWKREDLQPGIDWMVRTGGVPNWGANGGGVDLYYWYYGSLAVFQQRGETWKRWNESMKKALCDNQRRGGDEDGSWDPAGEFSDYWGRVGQTALSCLCLEVYYRYLPLYRE